MKLLTKTSLYYILFAIPVLAICSYLCYRLVYSEVKDNIDESIWKDMKRIERQLDKTDSIGNLISDLDSEITVKYLNDTSSNRLLYSEPTLADTELYDKYEDEILPYRILKTAHQTKAHKYSIVIQRTYLESDDLVNSILEAIVIMFVCLLLGFFLINIFIARRLWRPFHRTLEILQDYELDKGSSVQFNSTKIKEFSALNTVLDKMTKQIYSDFMTQKQFSENASHEMQTPLAVIKNKIELLIQSKTVSASDMEIIQSIYNSANKLSLINRALLLLSKIESNQFAEVKEVNLGALLERTLHYSGDMIGMKKIKVEKKIDPTFLLSMNPMLADVLVSNLLQNAIRHNITEGKIDIILSEKKLTISNSGHAFKGDPNEMFSRFRKSEQSAESIGLGMAIIKQICDYYRFKIFYSVVGELHTISINF